MESSSKDVLVKIALEMSLKDILNLCLTNKRFNAYICNNESFWLNKILRDYPNVTNYKEFGSTNKERYMNLSKDIVIDISIKIENTMTEYDDDDDEENEEEITREINVGYSVALEDKLPIGEIKGKIYRALSDFFQRLSLWGYYDVYIDEVEVCQDYKYFHEECLQFLAYNTREIRIYLYATEPIDEGDEAHDQLLLDDAMNDERL